MTAQQVLWTGGLDSSFRVCQLTLVERRVVQPIYVINPTRPSTMHEIRAMAQMRDAIEDRLEDGARLLPTHVVICTDYAVDSDLQAAYDRLSAQVHTGSQTLFLAVVARAQGWSDVDYAMHRWEDAPALTRLIFNDLGTATPVLSDPDAKLLHSAFSLPLLRYTKRDMWRIAEDEGFLDILKLRWFCWRPINNQPCGYCNPCIQSFGEGVGEGFRRPSKLRILSRRAVALSRRTLARAQACLGSLWQVAVRRHPIAM